MSVLEVDFFYKLKKIYFKRVFSGNWLMSSIDLKSILTYGAAYIVAKDLFNGNLAVVNHADGQQDGAAFTEADFKNYLKGNYNNKDPQPALVLPNMNGSNDTNGDPANWPWATIVKGSTLRDLNLQNFNLAEMRYFKQMMVDDPKALDVFKTDIFKDAGNKNVNIYNNSQYANVPQVVMLNNQGTDKKFDWLNNDKHNGPQMFFWNWAQSGLGVINKNSVYSDPDANLVDVQNNGGATTSLDKFGFTFTPAGDSQFPIQTYEKTLTYREEVSSSKSETSTTETGGSSTLSFSLKIGSDTDFWGGNIGYEQSWNWNKSISLTSENNYENAQENSVKVTFNPSAIPKSEDGLYHWSGQQQNIVPVKGIDPSEISNTPEEPAILTPGGKYIYVVEYDQSNFTSGFQHLQKIQGTTSGYLFVGTFYDWRAGTKDDAINYRPQGGNPRVDQLLNGFISGGGFKTFGIPDDLTLYEPDGKGAYKPKKDAYGNVIKTTPIFINSDNSITAVDSITLDSSLGSNVRTKILIDGNAYKNSAPSQLISDSSQTEYSSLFSAISTGSENQNKTKVNLDNLRGGLDQSLGVAYIASDNELVIGGRGKDAITLQNNSSAILGDGDSIEITGFGNTVTINPGASLLTTSPVEGVSVGKPEVINFNTSAGAGVASRNFVVLTSSTIMDLGWGGVTAVIKSSNNVIDSTHGDVSDPSAGNIFSFEGGSKGNIINNFLLGYDQIEFGSEKIKSAAYNPETETAELFFGDNSVEINIDFSHSGFNPKDPVEVLSTYLLTKLYSQGGLIKDGKSFSAVNFASSLQQLEDYFSPTTGTSQFLAEYILSPEILGAGQNVITPHKFLTWISIQAIGTGKNLSDIISDIFYPILPNTSSTGQSVDINGIKNYITSSLSPITTSESFKNGYAKISNILSGVDLNRIVSDTQYFNKIYYSAIVPVVESLNNDQLKALDQGVDEIITAVVDALAFATNGPGANTSYNKSVVNVLENQSVYDITTTGSFYVGVDNNTIIYDGPREQFKIQNFDGYLNVSNSSYVNKLNAQGPIDVIKNFDRVKFDDFSIAYDVGKAPGEIYNLYHALLGRDPDLEGIGFYINKADAGTPLSAIAKAFIASPEFQSMAAKSNSEFVDMLYLHGLDRTADTAGRAYWVGQLDKGSLSRADVAAAFASSQEDISHTITQVGTTGLTYIPLPFME